MHHHVFYVIENKYTYYEDFRQNILTTTIWMSCQHFKNGSHL